MLAGPGVLQSADKDLDVVKRLLIDVIFVKPCTSSFMDWAAHIDGAAFVRHKEKKLHIYRDPGAIFPLPSSTLLAAPFLTYIDFAAGVHKLVAAAAHHLALAKSLGEGEHTEAAEMGIQSAAHARRRMSLD